MNGTTNTSQPNVSKRMPMLLIDKGVAAYEEGCNGPGLGKDDKLRHRAGIHLAMWEVYEQAEKDAALLKAVREYIGEHGDGEVDVWSLRELLAGRPTLEYPNGVTR